MDFEDIVTDDANDTNNANDNNDKDGNDDKGILALGLDRDMGGGPQNIPRNWSLLYLIEETDIYGI